jgi:hypothetical protein
MICSLCWRLQGWRHKKQEKGLVMFVDELQYVEEDEVEAPSTGCIARPGAVWLLYWSARGCRS